MRIREDGKYAHRTETIKREAFDPLPHLLDCDIITNASDMDWGRKVLDDLAFAHLIPVFDGGSPIDTDDDGVLTDESYSTISLSVPGGVCLRCADVWGTRRSGERPGVRPLAWLRRR